MLWPRNEPSVIKWARWLVKNGLARQIKPDGMIRNRTKLNCFSWPSHNCFLQEFRLKTHNDVTYHFRDNSSGNFFCNFLIYLQYTHHKWHKKKQIFLDGIKTFGSGKFSILFVGKNKIDFTHNCLEFAYSNPSERDKYSKKRNHHQQNPSLFHFQDWRQNDSVQKHFAMVIIISITNLHILYPRSTTKLFGWE